MGAAIAQVRPPQFDAPQFDAPQFDALTVEAPQFEPSQFEASQFEPPQFAAPKFEPLTVAPDTERGQSEGLAALLAGERVRRGRELGSDSGIVSGTGMLPVLPALRDLLPKGALARGSVVSAGPWSLLCLALAAGPVAAGAWCAVAGIPEFGVAAAADAGLDPARLLLVPEPGPGWQQAVACLLDGFDLVVFRPPARLPAQERRKLEAAARRHGAVLLVAGDWAGAQVRLRIAAQEWTGVGCGHGRLRGRRAEVVADGRGDWSLARSRWLWLPGPDGTVAAVTSEVAETAGLGDTDLAQASNG